MSNRSQQPSTLFDDTAQRQAPQFVTHMAPREWNLCGDCWAITPDDDWPGLAHADDGSLTEAFDDPPILQCPACSYLHLDTDDDPGVWSGSVFELTAIRRREQA